MTIHWIVDNINSCFATGCSFWSHWLRIRSSLTSRHNENSYKNRFVSKRNVVVYEKKNVSFFLFMHRHACTGKYYYYKIIVIIASGPFQSGVNHCNYVDWCEAFFFFLSFSTHASKVCIFFSRRYRKWKIRKYRDWIEFKMNLLNNKKRGRNNKMMLSAFLFNEKSFEQSQLHFNYEQESRLKDTV
jgi:hypothetical protein